MRITDLDKASITRPVCYSTWVGEVVSGKAPLHLSQAGGCALNYRMDNQHRDRKQSPKSETTDEPLNGRRQRLEFQITSVAEVKVKVSKPPHPGDADQQENDSESKIPFHRA